MIDLPPVARRSAQRAGLSALRVLPRDMPADRNRHENVLLRLADRPHTVAFIDISRGGMATRPTLIEIDAALPRDATRQRMFLTRLEGGHVSEADRRWVHALEFADLLPEFDARDCEGSLRSALDGVTRVLGMTPLAPEELARHARVPKQKRKVGTPRATLRALTGKSAEDVAELLHRSLAIQDLAYRLRTYPQCFVGSEAVAWMSRRWHRPATEAVAIGQALGSLGLMVHVTHDHPFLDNRLFYRLAVSEAADRLGLGQVLASVRASNGVPVADRSYLGATYPRCWIGAEAVDLLVARHALARRDAWVLLHRLMQFGLIEHVTHERPFIDGAFYYRFTGPPADGKS
ncbi:hypothetical protein [Rhodoferax sediminis]|nr:hypothetical protein [Rhodoferax sediminis]